MRSLGAADLLVVLMFVVLMLDSRRLHALVRPTGRARRAARSGPGIPAGLHPDRVGLSLHHIQMRIHVDWQDGGVGWEGPEILPADEPDDTATDAPGSHPDATRPHVEPGRTLPVLWKPFPALPAAGATGDWPQTDTPTPAFC